MKKLSKKYFRLLQFTGILILTSFMFPTETISQELHIDTCEFEIVIKQQILPGDNWDFKYIISSKRLKIYKEKTIFVGDKEINQRNKLYDKKLSERFIDSLKILLIKIDLENHGENYISGALDGINWTFLFNFDCFQKQIFLDNYYIPELGILLDNIDSIIPKRKRYISFNYFNTRKRFEEK